MADGAKGFSGLITLASEYRADSSGGVVHAREDGAPAEPPSGGQTTHANDAPSVGMPRVEAPNPLDEPTSIAESPSREEVMPHIPGAAGSHTDAVESGKETTSAQTASDMPADTVRPATPEARHVPHLQPEVTPESEDAPAIPVGAGIRPKPEGSSVAPYLYVFCMIAFSAFILLISWGQGTSKRSQSPARTPQATTAEPPARKSATPPAAKAKPATPVATKRDLSPAVPTHTATIGSTAFKVPEPRGAALQPAERGRDNRYSIKLGFVTRDDAKGYLVAYAFTAVNGTEDAAVDKDTFDFYRRELMESYARVSPSPTVMEERARVITFSRTSSVTVAREPATRLTLESYIALKGKLCRLLVNVIHKPGATPPDGFEALLIWRMAIVDANMD